MTRIIVALVIVFAAVNGAWAEAWTCTYMMEGLKEPFLQRFLVAGNDLIDPKTTDHYSLLQNNEYGLVATNAFAEILRSEAGPTVGAFTIIINKTTGEF